MSDPTAHLADFVLKLKFEGTDEASTQIRRVRLPRIRCNITGAVSYEELVGLAISFVIPEQPVHASDFQVKLTYKDVEDDLVVIGSSEELLDAIDQYKEQRVLRITAEVKRTRTSVSPPPPEKSEVPLSRALPDNTCQPSDAALSDAGLQTGSTANAASIYSSTSPMLQNVVESVVNVILNAAVSINSRNQGSSPSHPVYNPEGVLSLPRNAVVSPPFPIYSDAVTDAPVVEEEVSAPAEFSVVEPPPPFESETVVPAQEVAPAAAEETKQEAAEKAPPDEAKEEERPFIHGRHTCDSCLTTPIIGERYHAINMSDYDLCAKCYEKTIGGSEIQFEAVELERDRHLQDRWHRRHERMNNGSGRGAVRRFGPRGHHHRWGPGPRPGPPGARRCGPTNGAPPPHRCPQGPPPRHPKPWKSREEQKASEENAMAMAIKLSLQDVQQEETAVPIKAAPVAKDPPAASKPPPPPSAPVEEESVKSASTDAAEPASLKSNEEKDVALKQEPVEPALVDTMVEKHPNVAPEPSAPMEEETKSTPASAASSTAPVQVETVEDDEHEEEAPTATDAFVVRMPSDDGSFSCDVSFVENQPPKSPAPSKDGSRESSFSSDAAGNGEIADMLGETLDKCAEAIDAMVSELDRTSFEVASSVATSFAGVQESQAEEAETPGGGEPAGGTEAEGATILESLADGQGEGKDLVSTAQSEEDWQVVSEDQQVGSDEELARAAQMIGSALFNSDMRSSGEVMSALTGSAEESDAVSYASSALTSLPLVSTQQVAAAQRQRWAKQLAQLRELGFDDDARCVEILERLSAANIGCGNDDEVSVRQVIDALWK